MANKTRFQCPYCQAIFAVKPVHRRFECPRCGHPFAIVRLDGHTRGWIAIPQMAWECAHSQVVQPFPGRGELHAAPPSDERGVQGPPQGASGGEARPAGAARQRRERRRKRRRLALPMALVGLAAVFIAVLLYPPGAMGRGEDPQGASRAFASGGLSNSLESPTADVGVDDVGPYIATATPTEPPASSTPTMTATPTTTPTPLPPNLAQATAWQATLEQAAAASHATQTLVAGNYAATRTALPPTLTAMAQDRQATATQKAAEATKRAAGPATR